MSVKGYLEVCAYNLQSCIIAQNVGAERVELCADPLQGGTTPAYGLIKLAREKIGIQLYPIIRPREGDFVYSDDEFAIMRRDIELCRLVGCDGISVGVQLPNGAIDKERMKLIIQWAYPMYVTCHRVFDTTPDLYQALDDLIDCGCARVLTSGGKTHASEAIDILSQLVKSAGGRISIMPGSGVRSSNIKALISTGAKEFHTSARISPQPSAIAISAFDPGHFYIADEEELKSIIASLV